MLLIYALFVKMYLFSRPYGIGCSKTKDAEHPESGSLNG